MKKSHPEIEQYRSRIRTFCIIKASFVVLDESLNRMNESSVPTIIIQKPSCYLCHELSSCLSDSSLQCHLGTSRPVTTELEKESTDRGAGEPGSLRTPDRSHRNSSTSEARASRKESSTNPPTKNLDIASNTVVIEARRLTAPSPVFQEVRITLGRRSTYISTRKA